MTQQQNSLPYRTVVAKPEDRKKVLIFVSFTCPFCAAYDEHLIRWSHTLPPDWTVEFVPVVLPRDRDSVIAARAFYAVRSIDPAYLDTWMPEVYTEIQNRGSKVDDPKTWTAIANRLEMRNFAAAWSSVKPDSVTNAYKELVGYGVDATPSMAIGGKYVITPDNTNGNEDLFFQLANGMVSTVISQP
ncbi:TPA: thiol:disulfide interchange protein DsbA/DsbL [Burkholderia lata]